MNLEQALIGAIGVQEPLLPLVDTQTIAIWHDGSDGYDYGFNPPEDARKVFLVDGHCRISRAQS